MSESAVPAAAPLALGPKALPFFLYLATLHTALLVASSAAGGKLIDLPGGLTASATVFSYMGTYVLLDVISELFGARASRLVINVGMLALLTTVFFFELAIWVPAAPVWPGQAAYAATLGTSWRLVLGGWLSYVVSQHLDVWGFFRLRQRAPGRRMLWSRALGSTALGQAIDTAIFMTIAFAGTAPLAAAMLGQYLLKLLIAALTLPLIYALVAAGHRAFARAEDGGGAPTAGFNR